MRVRHEEFIRILAFRQRHHTDGHSGCSQFFSVPDDSLDPGLVRISYENCSPGFFLQHGYLTLGQGCSQRGYRVAYTYLVQPDHIGIALAQYHSPTCGYLPLGIEPSEKQITFMEQIGLCSIQIFRDIALAGNIPAAEAGNIPGSTMDRKYYALPECIIIRPGLFILLYKPGFHQDIRLPALAGHIFQQGIASRGISDAECIHRAVLPAPLGNVLLGCRSILQTMTEELPGILIGCYEIVPEILLFSLLKGKFFLLVLDVKFVGKIFQGFGISHIPVMHYEGNRIA